MSEVSLSEAVGLKALLEVKGTIDLLFKGSSMIPAIHRNAVIHIEKLTEITPGDIYVFHLEYEDQHPRLICHRLRRVERGKCYFQGDNRAYQEVVKEDAIIGVVRKWA